MKSAADDKLPFTVYSYVKAVTLHVKRAQMGGTAMAVTILDPALVNLYTDCTLNSVHNLAKIREVIDK